MSCPAFSDHANYVSDACHHGLHHRCRVLREFCGEDCKCECHDAKDAPEPGVATAKEREFADAR